jgi:hypothetical protein
MLPPNVGYRGELLGLTQDLLELSQWWDFLGGLVDEGW